MFRYLVVGVVAMIATFVPSVAQTVVPTGRGYALSDTSLLKPPSGVKVAIIEFDDLECPYCARAVPIVQSAARQYKIPVEHHDFPLTEIHAWSFDAAVKARYLQDRVSPKLADSFRDDVFANQNEISSPDDLARFTQVWLKKHDQAQPFDMDVNGDCSREVRADRALGERIGIHSTPCIFVVTPQHWTWVADVDQLYHAVDLALAETRPMAAPKKNR